MDLDRFFTRLNPVIVALLRSPLQVLLSPGMMLITVTGRRSGRRYTIPVGYQRDGETLHVMVSKAARKQWWRNYREAAPVELRLWGRALTGRAVVVPQDSQAFQDVAERTLRRMPWLGRQFGIDYDRKQGLDTEQRRRLAAENALVRIDLDAPG